jgi:metal-sulfur cluster biosynthetic enzyme
MAEETTAQETTAEETTAQETTAEETTAQETTAQETVSQEVEDVIEALRDVVDPELGINVVDLGLVYGVDVDAEKIATVDMTLTSAACPLTDVIEEQAREALDGLVTDFRINWVWMPPWGPEHITEDGREQLRALGFNI